VYRHGGATHVTMDQITSNVRCTFASPADEISRVPLPTPMHRRRAVPLSASLSRIIP